MTGKALLQGIDTKSFPDTPRFVAGLFAGALGVDRAGEFRVSLIPVSKLELILFSGRFENPEGLF